MSSTGKSFLVECNAVEVKNSSVLTVFSPMLPIHELYHFHWKCIFHLTNTNLACKFLSSLGKINNNKKVVNLATSVKIPVLYGWSFMDIPFAFDTIPSFQTYTPLLSHIDFRLPHSQGLAVSAVQNIGALLPSARTLHGSFRVWVVRYSKDDYFLQPGLSGEETWSSESEEVTMV